MSFDPSELHALLSVVIAAILGGFLGLERELADKPAGLRTHMFVAAAAALLVHLGDVLVLRYEDSLGSGVMRTDPIRVIEAVLTGVGFLGAGTIIRHGGKGGVEGLTTAATILLTAGLGICAALGQYVLAVGTTLFAVLVLRLIGRFEHHHRLD